MDTIILAGGGTAGHIAPNLALLPFLKEFSVHYVGETGGMEESMAKDAGLPFHGVPCIKFHRGISLKNAKVPFVLCKGISQAKRLLKELNPCVVFSKGGYAALPVALAANKLHIPLVIHESDKTLGLSNKLVAKKARYVCATFPSVADACDNGILTGTPIRQELYGGKAENVYRAFGFSQNGKKNLLVFGGSQGALHLNRALEGALADVCRTFNVLHISGEHEYTGAKPTNYARTPFCKQMADCYAWADYIV
ncbi:MAG: glycosyltransferase, partial [Clostridiales bacterium]|nr:glycosyltransferase [Clostridiales bacterium]